MTVPFIIALGVGIAAIRNDKHASDDSFGLVSLCSIGPILSVLVLGLIYHPEGASYVPKQIPDINSSVELWGQAAVRCFMPREPEWKSGTIPGRVDRRGEGNDIYCYQIKGEK